MIVAIFFAIYFASVGLTIGAQKIVDKHVVAAGPQAQLQFLTTGSTAGFGASLPEIQAAAKVAHYANAVSQYSRFAVIGLVVFAAAKVLG
jgi:hypothetical protein